MPKVKEKKKQEGAAAKFISSPENLVQLLVKDPARQKFVLQELVSEGPPHKQGLTALLMQSSWQLIKAVEKMSGDSFELQKGLPVDSETEEEAIVLPVELPVHLNAKADKDKFMELIWDAPIHEVLAYTICLQAMEWSIKTVAKKG